MEFPAEHPGWRILDVILIILVILGVSFIFAWIHPFIYYTLVYNYGLPDTTTTEFALDFLVQFIVTLTVIAAVVLWYRRNSLRNLGFVSLPVRPFLTYGLGGGVVIFVAVMLVGALIQLLTPVAPQDFEKVLREATQSREVITLILIGSVLGPFYEEVLFRGVIYPVFRHKVGIRWGIVISALIFALVHADVARLLPLFLGGVGLAYIYEKSGSIYCSWAAHGTWNLIMALSLYVKT